MSQETMRPEEIKLQEIRRDIDIVDARISELLMTRLNYAERVVQTKIDAGITNIYLAEREDDILGNTAAGVPEDKKAEFTSLIKKMVEISRMHQYGMLYDQVEGIFDPLLEDVEIPENPTSVTVELIRRNIPGQAAAICGLVSDYKFNLTEIKRLDNSVDNTLSRLWITVDGNINDSSMQKMLLQLSQESEDFSILSVR